MISAGRHRELLFGSLCILVMTCGLVLSTGCFFFDQRTLGDESPPRGDVNNDGVVDQADADELTALFGYQEGDPEYLDAADLNDDGVIGLADLQRLVQILDAQAAE